MDVLVLAHATRVVGGNEGERRNIVTLIQQSGDLNPTLYVLTVMVSMPTRTGHWSRTEFEESKAVELYDQAHRDFIEPGELDRAVAS